MPMNPPITLGAGLGHNDNSTRNALVCPPAPALADDVCRLLLPGAAFDAISHDERLGVRQLRLLSAAVEGKRLHVQVVLSTLVMTR